MTTPSFVDHVGIAEQLHEARRTAVPTDFITSSFPDLGWADARAIARHSDELRLADGETQIGWKLGWTSSAMRTALGIDRPNWGTLWDSQTCDAEVAFDRFIHPKIEPELVWRSPITLAGKVSAAEVEESGGEWALGIEVVDPRFPSFDFQALDNTADNSSSAAIRVGEFSELDDAVSELIVTFSDGSDRRTGAGKQAMGSPWEAIAWLVRSLGEEALHVRAGDIVFTGGLAAPYDARQGVAYSLSGSPLCGTTLRFS